MRELRGRKADKANRGKQLLSGDYTTLKLPPFSLHLSSFSQSSFAAHELTTSCEVVFIRPSKGSGTRSSKTIDLARRESVRNGTHERQYLSRLPLIYTHGMGTNCYAEICEYQFFRSRRSRVSQLTLTVTRIMFRTSESRHL